MPGLTEAGGLLVPAVQAHPAIGDVFPVELLGAVAVVVLGGGELLVVHVGGFVEPVLEGALTQGALAAAPRARVPLVDAFASSFDPQAGNGNEAGVLEARGGQIFLKK